MAGLLSNGQVKQCGLRCAPIVPSIADSCWYDFSECDNIKAGATCKIRCKEPYVGSPSIGLCPADNFEPNRPPDWTPPTCSLPPGSECPMPETIPAGYRFGGGVWTCAAGYTGQPALRCIPDGERNCAPGIAPEGCLPLMPCAAPQIDACQFSVADCARVQPGSFCTVGCKDPYFGTPSVAACPSGNTDPGRALVLVEPQCALSCPPPVFPPKGYQMNGEFFRCANGYGGEPSSRCVIDIGAGCVSRMELSGCEPLQRCALPNLDRCIYDFSDCVAAKPGGSTCQVRCRAPYQGLESRAFCPPGNTDATREFSYTDPHCAMSCAEVSQAPLGYVQHPYQMTVNGWQCVDNHAGQVLVTCSTSSDCFPEINLAGCLPVLRCAPPLLTALQLCMYDVFRCLYVPSGMTCEVFCKAPYVGGSANSVCPSGNTVQNRPLEWNVPVCELECKDPDPLPLGYQKSIFGEWECSEGYVGRPNAECTTNLKCEAILVLTGCLKLVPCIVPPDAVAICHLDWSDCGSVQPGDSCEVRCKDPWLGVNTSTAYCPADNADPLKPLRWEDVECELQCDETSLRTAVEYVLVDWECAEGYAGKPARTCEMNSECDPGFVFRGCIPLVPCAPPQLSSTVDICMYDTSNCTAVEPGQSCELRCSPPYVGDPVQAFCPQKNTDPSFELLWVAPRCRLPCEDPDPLPSGYERTADCGLQCVDGYIGTARKTCELVVETESVEVDNVTENQTKCSQQVAFLGCDALVTCAPLTVEDTCRLDGSECLSVAHGASCRVKCRAPFAGAGAVAYCSADNIDPKQEPMWDPNIYDCKIPAGSPCIDPDPIPVEYVRNSSGWFCAPGYVGTPVAVCDANSTNASMCIPEWRPSGCKLEVPCDIPAYDRCQFDISLCPSPTIPSGGSCQIRCKEPYIPYNSKVVVSLKCPAANTNRSNLVWAQPDCYPVCGIPQPGNQDGYLWVNNMWRCDEGWRGLSITKVCIVDNTCSSVPTLQGCLRIVPCQPLVLEGLDALQLDASDCTNVMAGMQCALFCRSPPFVYEATTPYCPFGNTNPKTLLAWAPPKCNCPLPAIPPEGYLLNLFTQEYQCYPGYFGQPKTECITVSSTEAYLEFTGCSKIESCLTPTLENESACEFDVGCAEPVPPGGSCTIGCKPPFEGNSTEVSCSPNNTDPNFVVSWGDYRCDLTCPVTNEEPPPGYKPGKYECAAAYRGYPSPVCRPTNDTCGQMIEHAGCDPLLPCKKPTLAIPLGKCMFDVNSCASVQPSGFCNVFCKPPFVGIPTRATCRPDNTNPQQNLTMVEPMCELPCPDPSPIPAGYVKLGCGRPPSLLLRNATSGTLPGWRCADGYVGTAEFRCGIDNGCNPYTRLSGCKKTQPCAPPLRAGPESCMYNATDCPSVAEGGLEPGGSCTVECNPPYVGGPFNATCFENNTVAMSEVWMPPGSVCDLACPDPDWPDGYGKIVSHETGVSRNSMNALEWVCDEGYGGRIKAECFLDEENCSTAYLSLSGCEPLKPCADLVANQTCGIDVSNCKGLSAGHSCLVKCAQFFAGPSVTAVCPPGNINALQQPVLQVKMECSLACPDPVPSPVFAYAKEADGSWRCAANAVHKATAECLLDTTTCSAKWNLTGCVLLQPCVKPEWDQCKVQGCADVKQGQNCTASCKPPYVGKSFRAGCPANNTNSSEVLKWYDGGPPECDCAPAPEIPPGYTQHGDNWTCEEGYHGVAYVRCLTGKTCPGTISFEGCNLIVPCAPPDLSYLTNRSQCQRMRDGDDCNATCVDTFCIDGPGVTFRCPANNTDTSRQPTYISGKCNLLCEVCNLDSFIDTDARGGWAAGTLRFGPVHNHGVMTVPDVDSYRVQFADDCGNLIGDVLHVEPVGARTFDCCLADAYTLELSDIEVPEGASQLAVALRGAREAGIGDFPFGVFVQFEDVAQNYTTPPPRARTSGAWRLLPVLGVFAVIAGWALSVAASLHLSS